MPAGDEPADIDFQQELPFLEEEEAHEEEDDEIQNEDTWVVVDAYFSEKSLVSQQLEAFNDFFSDEIQNIVGNRHPIRVLPKRQYGDDDEAEEVGAGVAAVRRPPRLTRRRPAERRVRGHLRPGLRRLPHAAGLGRSAVPAGGAAARLDVRRARRSRPSRAHAAPRRQLLGECHG